MARTTDEATASWPRPPRWRRRWGSSARTLVRPSGPGSSGTRSPRECRRDRARGPRAARHQPAAEPDRRRPPHGILLMACRPADDVLRAAGPALEQAARWQITTSHANVLMTNVAQALRQAGRIGDALQGLWVQAQDQERHPAAPPPRARHPGGVLWPRPCSRSAADLFELGATRWSRIVIPARGDEIRWTGSAPRRDSSSPRRAPASAPRRGRPGHRGRAARVDGPGGVRCHRSSPERLICGMFYLQPR